MKKIFILFLFANMALISKAQEMLEVVDVAGVEVIGFYDFNGDNELDILFTNFSTGGAGNIGWIKNAGNNHFTEAHTLPGAYLLSNTYVYDHVNVLDFDSDGDNDIIGLAGSYDTGGYPVGTGKLVLALNNGQGEFSLITESTFVGEIGLIDLNNDGITEVLATHTNNLHRYDWNGSNFEHSIVWTVPTGSNAPNLMEVEIGDLNGDGFKEPVCIQSANYTATYHYGYVIAFYGAHNNDWTPTTLTTSFTGSNPVGGALSSYEFLQYLELADAEGDGDLDLFFNPLQNNGAIASGSVFSKLNNGAGVFSTFCGGGSFGLEGPYSQVVYLGNDDQPDFFTKYHFGISQQNRLNRNIACGFPGAAETTWASNAADWNGDGNLDLFQLVNTTNAVGTYTKKLVAHLGDSFGNFEPSTDTLYLDYSALPSSVTTQRMTKDLNNDQTPGGLVYYSNSLTQYYMSADGYMYDDYKLNITQTNLQANYATGDLNNDGFNDLLFTTGDATYGIGARDIYLRRNNEGKLNGSTTLIYDNTGASSSRLRALEIFDVNNDGNQDVVFITKTTGANANLFVKTGNGDYTLNTTITAATGLTITDYWLPMEIIDFDADGDKDIVVGGKWLRNNLNGTFTLAYTISNAALLATVADVDQDGDWDYLCTNQNNYGTMYLYLNNGDWTFASSTFYTGSADGHFVMDIDLDGDRDILSGEKMLINNGVGFDEVQNISYYSFLDVQYLPNGQAVIFYDTGGRRLKSANLQQYLACGDFAAELVIDSGQLVCTTTAASAMYTWADCNTGETVQTGSSNTFAPTYAGEFRVTATQGVCTATSSCQAWQILPYDLNGDQVMDIADLMALIENFGCTGTQCEYDLDSNGQVGVEDIMILLLFL